jgi:hypothetical protein
MKKLLLLVTILMVATTVLSATPTTQCTAATTLANLISYNSTGGCVSQDKIFSNFAYTPVSSPFSISAGNVDVTLVAILGANDTHGWSFTPANGQDWITGFTLSYTISVVPGLATGVKIYQSTDQINTTPKPNQVLVTDIQTGLGLGDTNPGTMTVNGTSVFTETAATGVYNDSSVHTSSTLSFTNPARTKGGLITYEQDWYEVNSAPEPVTFLLIGSGLIGLTFLRRRLNKG